MTDHPSAEPLPSRAKRPVGLTLAWLACWHVALFMVLVPGVIGYLLVQLCQEEGWGNVLRSRPGLILVIMVVLSAGSTWAWVVAGWEYYRSRGRRGSIWMGIALASGVLTGIGLATP